MLCSGHGNDEFSEGSLEKPVCSAIFVMLEFSAMAELIGTVYQAGHEDFIQRVTTSSPREGPKPKAQWRLLR